MPGILPEDFGISAHPVLQINPMASMGLGSVMGGGRMPPAANRNVAPQSAPENVTSMGGFMNQQIRSRNLQNFGQSGGVVTDTLPNGWMLGRLSRNPGILGQDHVLIDPQGSPALLGWSQRGLIHEGFEPDERGPLLDYLNAR